MVLVSRWSCVRATQDEQHAREVQRALQQAPHSLLAHLRVAMLVLLPPAAGVVDLLRLVIVYDPLSSQPPSPALLAELHQLLPPELHLQMPDDLLRQLPPALPTDAPEEEDRSTAILYQGTAPMLVTFAGRIEPGHSPVPSPGAQVISSPQAERPLTTWIASWLQRVRQNATESLFEALVPVYHSRMHQIYERMLADADVYLVSPSSVRLHEDIERWEAKQAKPHEAMIRQRRQRGLDAITGASNQRSLVLLLETPLPSPHDRVRGLLLHPCFPAQALLATFDPASIEGELPWVALHRFLSRFDGLWNMDLLSEEGEVLFRCGYECSSHTWIALNETTNQTSEPHWWGRWMDITCAMIAKQYARQAHPPSFPEQAVVLKKKQMMARHHGKGKPKEKVVEHIIQYRVLTYEVGQRQEKGLEESITQEQGSLGWNAVSKRPNWYTQAAPEDIYYERQGIEPYERRYPVRPDGTRREGRVEVVHDEPKWVARLRPEKRKTRTIQKVTSARHQSDPKHRQEGTSHAGPSQEER